MARYESDYLQIYEANRRLIDFLREIDSPVPRPLQVAADVAVSVTPMVRFNRNRTPNRRICNRNTASAIWYLRENRFKANPSGS